MSARIIQFRDPSAPLEGEEREAALALYREGLKLVAYRAMCDAFSAACKLAGKLSMDDVTPLFVEAMRRELARTGL